MKFVGWGEKSNEVLLTTNFYPRRPNIFSFFDLYRILRIYLSDYFAITLAVFLQSLGKIKTSPRWPKAMVQFRLDGSSNTKVVKS